VAKEMNRKWKTTSKSSGPTTTGFLSSEGGVIDVRKYLRREIIT
jgi:hypothetical protein